MIVSLKKYVFLSRNWSWNAKYLYHMRWCFGSISYQNIMVVVGTNAIRASPAFEERRSKVTALDASLKLPIVAI